MWVPCQCSIKAEFAQNTQCSLCRSEGASHSIRISRCGRRCRLFRGNLSQSGSSWGGSWRKSSLSPRFIRIDSGRTIVLLPNTRANDISVTIVSLLHCYSPSQIIASFMRILFWFFATPKAECAEILSAVSFSFSYTFSKTRGGRSSRWEHVLRVFAAELTAKHFFLISRFSEHFITQMCVCCVYLILYASQWVFFFIWSRILDF